MTLETKHTIALISIVTIIFSFIILMSFLIQNEDKKHNKTCKIISQSDIILFAKNCKDEGGKTRIRGYCNDKPEYLDCVIEQALDDLVLDEKSAY